MAWRLLIRLAVVGSVLLAAAALSGKETVSKKTISNKYISVTGYDGDGLGRYTIKLKEGDPKNKRDDNQYITFNDKPPSTYATLIIDGQVMRFGDPKHGRFIRPYTKDSKGRLYTVWKTNSNVEVAFVAKFVNGPTTGRPDTVKLVYQAKNVSTKKKRIGIRLMLDTYLGNNDGAPFSLPGRETFQTEREVYKKNMPMYWYTQDDISQPTVRAQGTLYADDLVTPDKIQFAAYRRVEPEPWGYQSQKGQRFQIWLDAPDSVVALYWFESEVKPAEYKVASTYYGVYGATLDTGKYFNVSIGAPLKVKLDPFSVSADIENAVTAGPVRKMKTKLYLRRKDGEELDDRYFKFDGAQKWSEKVVAPKQVVRPSWKLQPTKYAGGKYELVVEITGEVNGKKIKQETSRPLLVDSVAAKLVSFDLSGVRKQIEEARQKVDTLGKELKTMSDKVEALKID